MELKVIAYARNGHTDKFGIPRQSREESPIVTRIVFEPEFRVAEALRGIEGYSHLWLIWGFSETSRSRDAETSTDSWSPTVRPPRLGGNTRMGVFATRSPYRPNPLGLSSVKLIKVQRDNVQGTKGSSLELIVSGADLLDGTPIYDIKPYLSFSDSHEAAQNGFAEETKDYRLEVDLGASKRVVTREWTDNGPTLDRERTDEVSEEWMRDVTYILSQDPRPAYHDDPSREYKLDYAGYTITFIVDRQTVHVKKIVKI